MYGKKGKEFLPGTVGIIRLGTKPRPYKILQASILQNYCLF